MYLKDKVALVTGASRGIGAAIADELAARGADVIGTATSENGAQKILGRFKEKGLKGHAIDLNVNDNTSIEKALAFVESECGMPDILVNNAGVTRDNLMLRMKPDEWDEVINTNLSSVYRLSKACIRSMIKKRWGRIISISSVVASSGNPGQANYAASKAGLIGFSKSLAHEIATRGVTVNVVSPGFIQTDMTNRLTEDQKKAIVNAIPMGAIGEPDDVAHAVSFLASPYAAYITGQTLHVNGGMYMD